jgi:hypothetical protein
MVNTIDINKALPRERWGEFFDQCSDGNRGRLISVSILDPNLDNRELVEEAPLMAMIYDPPHKGDDVVIEIGRDEVNYAHTVVSPIEVFTGQDSNGKLMMISIQDAAGLQTLVEFPEDP